MTATWHSGILVLFDLSNLTIDFTATYCHNLSGSRSGAVSRHNLTGGSHGAPIALASPALVR